MLARNQADGVAAGAEQVKEYGALIHEQARRLMDLVEQTLEFAGIQARRRKPVLRELACCKSSRRP